MKKTTRSIALFLAIAASVAFIAHLGHADADHSKIGSKSCVVCQTISVADIPLAVSLAPAFFIAAVVSLGNDIRYKNLLVTAADSRGPPLA